MTGRGPFALSVDDVRIEHMFESGAATAAAVVLDAPASEGPASNAEVIRELQARIRGMQRNRLDTRAIPTHPALADLLPGGALVAGGRYQVAASTTLALALLQGPSAAGAWCAVVGVPDLGVEAAAGLGIDLERLVLVPHPGEQWMSVVSALVDVVSVVLVKPPVRDGRSRVPEAAAGKLAARLRQREAVLVALGEWPQADAALTISESAWAGLGSGFGHLTARQVTVGSVASAWAGRVKSRRLRLPGADQQVAAIEPRVRDVVPLARVARTTVAT